MLIKNAVLETVEHGRIPHGFLQIESGKIVAMGNMEDCPKLDGLDYSGYTLYPGFIDCHCHLGMWEDSLGFEGEDGNEDTDPITPQLDALDAINPMDSCFQEAVSAGVTTVVTGPGSANPIGGHWIALKTVGRRVDTMVVKRNIGMKFALGENPKATYNDKNQTPVTRMATAALIREQLQKAKRYQMDCQRALEDEELDQPEYDAKCEALLPVLERKEKAFFHAHRADDIFTAIRLIREYQLDGVLVHGTDGHLIADLLEEEHLPVITGPMITDRSKPELRNQKIQNPAILAKYQIPTAICTDHPEVPIQYLPLSCGIAIKGGLSREKALQAITIEPARICGLEQRLGSLQVGKDADIVVYPNDTDPFSVYSSPFQVIIDGKFVYEETK